MKAVVCALLLAATLALARRRAGRPQARVRGLRTPDRPSLINTALMTPRPASG